METSKAKLKPIRLVQVVFKLKKMVEKLVRSVQQQEIYVNFKWDPVLYADDTYQSNTNRRIFQIEIVLCNMINGAK